jgi:hypothetical protein
VNTANIHVPDGWYSLVSTGHHVHAVPDPESVVAASEIGVNVCAARPGQVAVTIDLAYRPPTDHVPRGWTLAASGTFIAATLLRIETPDGVVHDEFGGLAQIILPSEITYRMFRRFRDDTGLEQHLFELTPAMMLDPQGRPARIDVPEHGELNPDDNTGWQVACPTSTPGSSVLDSGREANRAEALRALVDAGLSLTQRETPDAGPLSPIFVCLGAEFAWVKGFGDPALSKSDLAQVVLDGVCYPCITTSRPVCDRTIERHAALESDCRLVRNECAELRHHWCRRNSYRRCPEANRSEVAERARRTLPLRRRSPT